MDLRIYANELSRVSWMEKHSKDTTLNMTDVRQLCREDIIWESDLTDMIDYATIKMVHYFMTMAFWITLIMIDAT